jgi:hypothetical protein
MNGPNPTREVGSVLAEIAAIVRPQKLPLANTTCMNAKPTISNTEEVHLLEFQSMEKRKEKKKRICTIPWPCSPEFLSRHTPNASQASLLSPPLLRQCSLASLGHTCEVCNNNVSPTAHLMLFNHSTDPKNFVMYSE